MENKTQNKTINLSLNGLDGNAYSLMGAFQSQARRENWTQEEIKVVITECKSKDYDHLLQTLMKYCKETDEDKLAEELDLNLDEDEDFNHLRESIDSVENN